MELILRQADFPEDYPAVADVLTAEAPDWPVTAEELAYDDTIRDPRFYQAVFIAEHIQWEGEKLAVGTAIVGHDTFAHRDGKLKIEIHVRPDWQGQGIGTRLYQTVLAHIRPLAPHELQTDVWAAHTRALRFVHDRGFVEVWRRIDATLDVATFDFAPYLHLEKRLAALGIQIKTYAELASDADRDARLYALDQGLWQDVPYGETPTERSFEQFMHEEILIANFLPDACFLALSGDTFVGYTNLLRGDGYYMTNMTGVLREYRGKGVATCLKLQGIHYASTHGKTALRTTNDFLNVAMRSLNAKLGFREEGAMIRFIKQMEVAV